MHQLNTYSLNTFTVLGMSSHFKFKETKVLRYWTGDWGHTPDKDTVCMCVYIRLLTLTACWFIQGQLESAHIPGWHIPRWGIKASVVIIFFDCFWEYPGRPHMYYNYPSLCFCHEPSFLGSIEQQDAWRKHLMMATVVGYPHDQTLPCPGVSRTSLGANSLCALFHACFLPDPPGFLQKLRECLLPSPLFHGHLVLQAATWNLENLMESCLLSFLLQCPLL